MRELIILDYQLQDSSSSFPNQKNYRSPKMAVAFLMTSLMKKLASLVPQASASTSSDEELHELGRILKSIRDELNDAEGRDTATDRSSEERLRELKEVAYDAEDIMDEYEYEVLRAKAEARRRLQATGSKHEVLLQNFNHPKVSISYQLAIRVNEIKKRFEEIDRQWKLVSLSEKDGKRRRVKTWKPMETTSLVDVAKTFGREDEKKKIIEWLLKEEDCHVSVLPIVGMGGIGKTTLAQMVYNDPLVHKKFPLKGWVCVSEDSDIESLKLKITLSFSNATKKSTEGGEQFLVLDDIWYQNRELWCSLKAFLIGAGTCKVLVTTRNGHVAIIMQTTLPIYLGSLSFNNCWLLFKKIAFEQRDHSRKVVFRDIGMKIVEKCGGLPLAVKVLACALSYEEDIDVWIDTLDSWLWEFDDEKSNILPALKLSYDRMPIELRQCFMYLSLFPKNSPLQRSVIVKQWMSQGFLHAEDEKIEEDIGNAYYDELLQRSIIQCYVGKLKEFFIMHDLIHDLAQSVARDGYLLITSDELQSIPKSIRHVSIYLSRDAKVTNVKHLFESQLPRERLRTLILPYIKGFPIVNLLQNFTCLRTLVLKEYEDLLGNKEPLELLDSIGNLKHLRYLDLHNHKFHPASLYKLYHLQTFRGCLSDEKSPGGIGDLINLRHLEGYDRDCLPREIGWLTNLQSLLTFTVGEDSWRCKVRDLKHLNHIRGRFHVIGLENVKWLDVTPPKHLLMTKPGIENLYLWWGDDSVQQKVDDELAKQVLECLRPHPNVAELSIQIYPGSIFPLWLGDASFSKLQDLQLSGGNCMSLPALGQLPSLKSLCIMRMERVKSVGRELLLSDPLNPIASALNATVGVESSSCCFPSLEELTFREMDEWEEWHGVQNSDFPCLRLLCIENCPKLKWLPSLSSLTELTFYFYGWKSELLSDRCRLPMLKILKIIFHTGASLSFPDYQIIRSLEELVISMSMSLRSVCGFGNLTSLRRLEIGGCPSLRIPPEERLPPDLEDVQILGCPEAEKWYSNQVLGRSEDHCNQQIDDNC